LTQILSPRLRPPWIREARVAALWRETAGAAAQWIAPFDVRIASGLEAAASPADAARFALQIPGCDRSPFCEINFLLRRFDRVLWTDDGLRGVLSCASVLQAAVEVLPASVEDGAVVYRGFEADGAEMAAVFCSVLDKVVVFHGFTMAGRDRRRVLRDFVRGSDGILFEIVVRPGVVAADVGNDDLLIGADSLFRVVSVGSIEDCVFEFPVVRLEWVGAWPDGDPEYASR
jgi:hypothetical protein